MACHHCTLTECLEEERTFLMPACDEESMSLDSILTLFIVVLESHFSFISACALCYTLRLSFSPSVHYVHIVRFIFLSIFYGTALDILQVSCFLLLKFAPRSCGCHRLVLFSSPSLLILSCLLCIGCCLLLNLQCLPIIVQFERQCFTIFLALCLRGTNNSLMH
jgi:hypothetical protein